MEHIANKETPDTLLVNETARLLEEQRLACAAIKCKNIGRAGCVLEGLLPNEAKLRLAAPCQMAVSKLPERRYAA